MWARLPLGIDATYALDPHPTGVAVYSREILNGVAPLLSGEPVTAYVRPHRLRIAWQEDLPVPVWPLIDALGTGASLFHGLNQRLPHKRRGQRMIATFHDLFVMTGDYSTPEFRARFTALAREAVERADLIITVSRFTADQVRDLLGVAESRLRVIPHGVRAIESSGDAPGGAKEKMILHVGAIQSRKNVARLVKAFEALEPGWKLVLAGGAGYGAAEAMRAIEESPRRSDISVTGYVSDAELASFYSRASVFAFPSLDEGFGIPILDAMARGIPVLTANRSATAEVAGNAALLVDPMRVDAIADGLTRLTRDAALREDLAVRGRAHASEFSWERASRETVAVYGECHRL